MSRVMGLRRGPSDRPGQVPPDSAAALVSVRSVVIIGLSILVGLSAGVGTGIAAGLKVAAAYGTAPALAVAFVSGSATGALTGLAAARNLHALVDRSA